MVQSCIPVLMLSSSLLVAETDRAFAQEFWADTFLLDVYVGSHRSSVANSLSKGGYELSGGEFVDFHDWYTPVFPDTTILVLKQVSPDFGITWGVSTGEKGEKYQIHPALQIGFVYQYVPFENSTFSIKATYPFFGKMTEKTCVGYYENFGGDQVVNCRLAADIMPPEETLDYLIKLRGETDARISASFSFVF
jgi:hypothetical protein